MNISRALLQISCVGVAALRFALCHAETPSDFQNEFFRPVLISPVGISQDRLARLTRTDISDLTSARHVLGEFFQRLESPSGNPLQLVTPQYAHEASSRLAMRTALIADETSVVEVGLTDFKFVKPDSLELRFYALVTTEGTFSVGEGKAELSKLGPTWKIAHVQVGAQAR